MAVRPTVFKSESEVKPSAHIIDELLLAYFQSIALGANGVKTAIILDINLFYMFNGAKKDSDFDKFLCAELFDEDGNFYLTEMTDKEYINKYIDEILKDFENPNVNLTFHLLNLHKLIMFFINHNFEYIHKKYSKIDLKSPLNRLE